MLYYITIKHAYIINAKNRIFRLFCQYPVLSAKLQGHFKGYVFLIQLIFFSKCRPA